MKNPIKRLNDFIGEYRWIVITAFLFMFLNQGSKAVDHLFNIYDNVSELESMNEEITNNLEAIDEKLSSIESSNQMLYDIESHTAR